MSGRKFGGSAGGSKASSSLKFQKAEPKFLQDLKAQLGYKDQSAHINDKFGSTEPGLASSSDSDGEGHDEEAPTVVVLNKGDLTKDEVEAIRAKEAKTKEEDKNIEPPPDGRILFRKPTTGKRSTEDDTEPKKPTKDKSKKAKTSLLSFGDDEEEEDDD